MWWSWKNWFWTISILGGCGSKCGGLERPNFEQFLFCRGCGGRCGGVVVLKELILNSFYFGTVWWSWKNWFWTILFWGGCGGLDRTDFEQFLLWDSVVVLKELILNSIYSWDSVVVMKELILNSFYFGTVWWPWQNWFWTVSTLGGCGGLERTDFEHFLLLGQCGGHERTYFEQFLLWDSVVVMKELILNNFYFGRLWWPWKAELILNSFYFGTVWVVLKELILNSFYSWDSVVVMKELILNSFYFGKVWWSWKNWFWTVSTLGECSCHERTDFEQFLFWDNVVVLTELILNSFYFGRGRR